MSSQLQTKKRLKYTPEVMARAIAAVRSGAMSKKKAAITFNVPRTTLLDKLAGRVPEIGSSGPKPALNSAEETTLVNYVKLMQEIGYPLTRSEFLKEIKKILDIDGRKTPFKNNMPGNKWFCNFVKRHPDLAMRKPQGLGQERANVTLEKIQSWYETLISYLQHEVPDYEKMIKDPRRVFNGDESGFPLSVKPDKVLACKGATNVYQVVSNTKLQITVMAACNAVGEFVPPMILFPGERLTNVGLSGFEEAVYRTTKSGWMDTDSFLAYLVEIVNFAKENDICFPIILFVDGHSTHMSRSAAEYCRDNQVVLYCLVPNATHLMQPLDVGFFSPMKNVWKQTVKAWQIEHFGETVGKKDFPGLLKQAWGKVATFENASHGFRKSGLFPLSITGIDVTKLGPSQVAEKVKEHNMAAFVSSKSGVPLEREKDATGKMSSETIILSNEESKDNGVMISQTQSTPQETVAPAFQKLFVPTPKQKPKVNRIGEQLPKAISGARAIEMLKEREMKKKEEEKAKAQRKEERIQKKIQREGEKERKRKEREDKKKQRIAVKTKEKKSRGKKKRKYDSDTESDKENDDSMLLADDVDSDNFEEEFEFCPACNRGDQHPSRWVKCVSCATRWHFMCANRPEYELLDETERKKFEFVCPMCE